MMYRFVAYCFLLFYCGIVSSSQNSLFLKSNFNNWHNSHQVYSLDRDVSNTLEIKKGRHELVINTIDDEYLFNLSGFGNTFSLNEGPISIDFSLSKVDLPIPSYRQKGVFLELEQDRTIEFSVDSRSRSSGEYTLSIKEAYSVGIDECNNSDGKIFVSNTFSEGEYVRNAITGELGVVKDEYVSFQDNSEAFYLVESALNEIPNDGYFSSSNIISYFAFIDRFNNGDVTNDLSYERFKDERHEIGTFHGGDLKGVIQKLDYLESLGINLIVLTSPLEQIHGWVGGGRRGDFPHFGYHGYYTKDYRNLDDNFGSRADLRNLVIEAHRRNIKLFLNIAINHPGYATFADMQEDGFGAIKDKYIDMLPERWTAWRPAIGESWHSFNDYIDFQDDNWNRWWGNWVRANISTYDKPGLTKETASLYFLPDFKTESSSEVKVPKFLNNTDLHESKATVREHLVSWLSDWVKNYGVDGFLIDAAEHVDRDTWLLLKKESQQAYEHWYNENPKVQSSWNNSFYLIGEKFSQGIHDSSFYEFGFDGMLNFQFQQEVKTNINTCLVNFDNVYESYSNVLAKSSMIHLSYLSSPDTYLNSKLAESDDRRLKRTMAYLSFLPGSIQLFYGDETTRVAGQSGSDRTQGTRSDMNWNYIESSSKAKNQLLWSKLLNFRKAHYAIANGTHKKLSSNPYTFSRESINGADKVVIAINGF